MKKTALIFLLYISIVSNSFGWDSTAAKFYPLAVGNVWSYHHINWAMMGNFCIVMQSQYDYVRRVVSDTLMPNGKRYFKFNDGDLERIDSSNMNVHSYYMGGERIIDSLLAKKNNYFRSYRSGTLAIHQVNDTTPVIFEGISRRGKQILGNGLVGHLYTLVSGLGLCYEKYCEFGGSTETLNGCIINGIQYGQILGIEKSEWKIPFEFSLSQNYPNPFNPVTKIKFSIPPSRGARGVITLIIYDILSREVVTLVNEQLQPGTYEVEWDGSNYSSGIYYYNLFTTEFVETKKMVLIK